MKARTQGGEASPIDLRSIRPMDAVTALYAEGEAKVASAIVSSLSKAVFEQPPPKPASWVQTALAKVVYRIVKRTTRRFHAGENAAPHYRNPLLESSKHPYAHALLGSSSLETQSLIEGGDPMNGPYMMISPEIRDNAGTWDKLFLSSVQGKDVQLRFVWETQATYEQAKTWLDRGAPVRLKALAAGTGLSMILAYDRLIRDGMSADRITCRITDRDVTNTAKTNRLLSKLAVERGWKLGDGSQPGISAATEDVFAEGTEGSTQDVITAVGILEYLQRFTCDTTEQRHSLPELEEPGTAVHLVEKLNQMTNSDSVVIVNTYRPHSSTRILELFGRRFDYRHPADLDTVLATGGFHATGPVGSSHIYDVAVYRKKRDGLNRQFRI